MWQQQQGDWIFIQTITRIDSNVADLKKDVRAMSEKLDKPFLARDRVWIAATVAGLYMLAPPEKSAALLDILKAVLGR